MRYRVDILQVICRIVVHRHLPEMKVVGRKVTAMLSLGISEGVNLCLQTRKNDGAKILIRLQIEVVHVWKNELPR